GARCSAPPGEEARRQVSRPRRFGQLELLRLLNICQWTPSAARGAARSNYLQGAMLYRVTTSPICIHQKSRSESYPAVFAGRTEIMPERNVAASSLRVKPFLTCQGPTSSPLRFTPLAQITNMEPQL